MGQGPGKGVGAGVGAAVGVGVGRRGRQLLMNSVDQNSNVWNTQSCLLNILWLPHWI